MCTGTKAFLSTLSSMPSLALRRLDFPVVGGLGPILASSLPKFQPTGLGYGLCRRHLRDVLGKVSPATCLIIGIDANADFHAADDQGVLIGTLLAPGEPARNDHMFNNYCAVFRLGGSNYPGVSGPLAGVPKDVLFMQQEVQDAVHKWWKTHHPPCLAAMPTLSDAEFAVRRQAGRKAPGPDSIPNEVWKLFPTYSGMWFWRLCTCIALICKEPLEFKRALVCALYKKGPAALPENYRSIALLNGMAKVWHGHVRRTIGQSVLSRYGPLQLGGRAGVPVSFAVTAFRAAVDLCRAEGRCYAALFVDIQAAYYEASRDLIFRGDGQGDTPAEPHLQHLAPLVQSLLTAGALELLGVPPDEIALLHDCVAVSHWCLVGSSNLFLATRGSRPGDGLADVLFGALFAIALRHINAVCRDEGWGHLSAGGHVGRVTEALQLGWADDLAVLTDYESPADLQQTFPRVATVVLNTLRHLRFRVNLGAGKTEALLAITGNGAVRSLVAHRHLPYQPAIS
ncbi:unnamed protein product [Symbiodinium sp. KB8]|nr:unnamed protein product [Symbiodinium sp. KB8]